MRVVLFAAVAALAACAAPPPTPAWQAAAMRTMEQPVPAALGGGGGSAYSREIARIMWLPYPDMLRAAREWNEANVPGRPSPARAEEVRRLTQLMVDTALMRANETRAAQAQARRDADFCRGQAGEFGVWTAGAYQGIVERQCLRTLARTRAFVAP